MTDTEIILAAEARLEEILEIDAADGVWRVRDHTYVVNARGDTLAVAEDVFDADTIAMLHGTVEAQLALLRLALEYGDLPEGSGSRFAAAAVNLARAIVGVLA